MNKRTALIFCSFIMLFNSMRAEINSSPDIFQTLLDHREKWIQEFAGERIYLMPESIQLYRSQFYLADDEAHVKLPTLYEDADGLFILAKAFLCWECTRCGLTYTSKPPPKCGGKINGKNCNSTQFKARIYGD